MYICTCTYIHIHMNVYICACVFVCGKRFISMFCYCYYSLFVNILEDLRDMFLPSQWQAIVYVVVVVSGPMLWDAIWRGREVEVEMCVRNGKGKCVRWHAFVININGLRNEPPQDETLVSQPLCNTFNLTISLHSRWHIICVWTCCMYGVVRVVYHIGMLCLMHISNLCTLYMNTHNNTHVHMCVRFGSISRTLYKWYDIS